MHLRSPFSLLDNDRVGKISEAEFKHGFNILDVDHDGCTPRNSIQMLAKGFSFKVLDWNGDGLLDWRKYAIGFDIIDTDKDGYIFEAGIHCASMPFSTC